MSEAERPVCLYCKEKPRQNGSNFCSDRCDVFFHYTLEEYSDWQLQEKER